MAGFTGKRWQVPDDATLMTDRAWAAIPGLSPVLVLENSPAQRRLLARTLAKWGYETIEAESGEAALEVTRTQEIDIVISD